MLLGGLATVSESATDKSGAANVGLLETEIMGPSASAVCLRVGGFLKATSGVGFDVEGFLLAVSGVRREPDGFLDAVSDVRDGEGFLAAMGAGGGAGTTCSRLALGAGVPGTIMVVTTGLRLAGGSSADVGAALIVVVGEAVPVSTKESVCANTRLLLRILKPPTKLNPAISFGDR